MKTMSCHHFYSMKDFNTVQELRRPPFVKDVIYPTALKSCCAVFTASIFTLKVPPGTHDRSDGFLKNVTIYSRSPSRSVQCTKPHVQVCIHPFTSGSCAEAVVKQQFHFAWFVMWYHKKENSGGGVNGEAWIQIITESQNGLGWKGQ